MFDAAPSQPGPDVLGRIFFADVRRLWRVLPRQRVSPAHRQAVNHRHGVAAAGGREEYHIVLRAEIVISRNLLRIDVTVGDLHLVESQAPPAFTLWAQPGGQQGAASGAPGMRIDGRPAGKSYSCQAKGCNFPPQRFGIDLLDDERPARELVSSTFKGLLGSF